MLAPILSLLLALVEDGRQHDAIPRLELAGPGIQKSLAPDEIVVFRTALSREESEQIAGAIQRGSLQDAFRASERIGRHITGHGRIDQIMRGAIKRGQIPLFATPYPSTAWLYVKHGWTLASGTTCEPVTYALVIPESAVIWENSRAHRTQGLFYSMTYSDAEYVVDARQVRRVLVVPPELLRAIGEKVEELAGKNIVRTQHKNAFKDRDEDLAVATSTAIMDLRVPSPTLGRPFLEVPLVLPGIGGVMKGQRVLLKDGQVVTLKEARASRLVMTEAAGGRWQQLDLDDPGAIEHLKLSMSKVEVPWTTEGNGYVWDPLLNALNLSPDLIARPVQPGERVSQQERAQTWDRYRAELGQELERELERLHVALEQERKRGDAGTPQRWEQSIPVIERAIALTKDPKPPWWGGVR